MNVGNFGNLFIFGTGFAGAGFDMAAYTSLILTFTRSDNTELIVENPDVTLGAVDYTLPSGQIFNAHQYVKYTFLEGDVTVAGPWKVRLTYDQSTAIPPISYTSDIGNFTVGV